MNGNGRFTGGPADGQKFTHLGHKVGDLIPYAMLVHPIGMEKRSARWQQAIYEFRDESGDVHFTGRYEEQEALEVKPSEPDNLGR